MRPYSTTCWFISSALGQVPIKFQMSKVFRSVGRDGVPQPHFGRDHLDERRAFLQCVNIVHRATDRLVGEVLLILRNILVIQAHLFNTANGDECFAHAVLHAFDQRGHADEAGHTQNDSEHREH